MIKKYNLNSYILKWDNDPFKTNNLYIDEVWNMKDTLGYEDSCVLVNIIDGNTFRFTTFNGLSFLMKVNNNEVICIEKKETK